MRYALSRVRYIEEAPHAVSRDLVRYAPTLRVRFIPRADLDLVTGEVRTILNVPARIHAIDWNPVTGELLYGGVTDSGEPLLAIYSDQMRFISQP